MELTDKLEILADAAKYDASCAGGGAPGRSSQLRCSMKKIAPFIVTADYSPVNGAARSAALRRSLTQVPQPMDLWTQAQAA